MNTTTDENDIFFGDIPPEINALLQQGIAVHASDPRLAENHFREALARRPDILCSYRCLVKHYNRQRQFDNAINTVRAWLTEAVRQAGSPADWNEWQDASSSMLGALKAFAFVELRRGRLEEAQAAIARLQQLDPEDGTGVSVLAALAH
ncbi:MAG: hypothetical protein IPJ38_10475 [Dechloromonas sp.]|uniref:Tetratricopeptide repeat protein n=1 Tax=Candidatus Dechloromonas phosphorivorans TaxID=2899244 RepID=A0A935MW53_9RHOO|nr:hypothetical protein [Candidatus Dechloromonas phosphorivorans]